MSLPLEGWDADLTRSALVDYALACPIDILDHRCGRGDSALDALTVEVVYDRALIRLCNDYDIEVVRGNFARRRQQGHGSSSSWLGSALP